MPLPFRAINKEDIVLQIENETIGQAMYSQPALSLLVFSREELEKDCGEPDVNGNYSVAQLRDSAEMQRAIAFAQTYVIKDIHKELEKILALNDEEFSARDHLHLLYPRNVDELPDDAEALAHQLEENYRKTGSAGAEERYLLVSAFFNHKIDEALETFADGGMPRYYRAEEKHQALMPDIGKKGDSWLSVAIKNFKMFNNRGAEKMIGKTLKDMPEWLQLLVNDTGMMTMVTNAKDGGDAQGTSLSLMTSNMPWIYLQAKLMHSQRGEKHSQQRERVLTMREELIHSYQLATDINLSNLSDEENEISARWKKAATALIAHLDKTPDHPALELIQKTEPNGGSLMKLTNDRVRIRELLVDIFDAEDYLHRDIRAKGGDDHENKKVETQLRDAFGDTLYEISREYLTNWIDQAAVVAERTMGKDEVARLKQKWLADPFNHEIIIHNRPEFALPADVSGPSPK